MMTGLILGTFDDPLGREIDKNSQCFATLLNIDGFSFYFHSWVRSMIVKAWLTNTCICQS